MKGGCSGLSPAELGMRLRGGFGGVEGKVKIWIKPPYFPGLSLVRLFQMHRFLLICEGLLATEHY